MFDTLYYIAGNLSFLLVPLISFIVIYSFVVDYDTISLKWGLTKVMVTMLIAGSLFGYLGNIPVFAYEHTLIAINIGGALIPLILSYIFLKKVLEKNDLYIFLVSLPVFSAGMILFTTVYPDPGTEFLYGSIPVYALVFTAIMDAAIYYLLKNKNRAMATVILFQFLAILTYSVTIVVPSQGIESGFPFYLLPSIAAAVFSIIIWRSDSMKVAFTSYAIATLGVLIGADIIHQPSLYGSSISIIGSIGGAGPLDMVFQAGLVAFAITLLYIPSKEWKQHSSLTDTVKGEVMRSIYLSNAYEYMRNGKLNESITSSMKGLEITIEMMKDLMQAFSVEDLAEKIPQSYFNIGDYRTLENLAGLPADYGSAVEVNRASIHIISKLDQFRESAVLPNLGRRVGAGIIDLLLFTLPMFMVLLLVIHDHTIYQLTSYSFIDGILFNALFLIYTSVYFLYLLFVEWFYGQTVGKYVMNIKVVSGSFRRAKLMQALMRNVTKLPMMLFLFAAAWDMALVFNFGVLDGNYNIVMVNMATIVGILILLIVVSLLAPLLFVRKGMWRQRLGDIFGDTVVIKSVINMYG